MPHSSLARTGCLVQSRLLQSGSLTRCRQVPRNDVIFVSRAAFASAADAATKEGSEAKKEAKKSALETALSALKVLSLLITCKSYTSWTKALHQLP